MIPTWNGATRKRHDQSAKVKKCKIKEKNLKKKQHNIEECNLKKSKL